MTLDLALCDPQKANEADVRSSCDPLPRINFRSVDERFRVKNFLKNTIKTEGKTYCGDR